jgi:exodeoxyribonuclease V beta subunit
MTSTGADTANPSTTSGTGTGTGAPATRAPFDVAERTTTGITVLEASAGTGKTHTVASIVVAEVAAGRPLEELLVVTFTRKATGTLRERVWQRLTEAARALEPTADPTDDLLLAHLRAGPAVDVAARKARLERAVSDFDAATIATTHGFCQHVLASLGVAGDAERDLEVVEDLGELVRDAVDDLFVRRFHGGGPILFTRDAALRIAQAVVDNPDARVAPVDPDSETERLRRRFATTLRDRIMEQKRRGRIVTFDDLLTRLADSIADPVRGEIVAQRLRRRYSMAIVDEFQDTDTVQWRILEAAFGTGEGSLVLVGDPKQAVYAFRGGDVHAYLRATAGAKVRTLDVSWRSDQPLLDGLDAFFRGSQLGAPTIRHRPLHARPGAEEARLLGPDVGAPFTVRIVDNDSPGLVIFRSGLAKKDSAQRVVFADLAAEVQRMLTNDTVIVDRDTDGAITAERPLNPRDIAVLVRKHRDAESVRDALHAIGTPAVVHGGAGVLGTTAATDWLTLLQALEQPSFNARLRAVTLGPFIGWDATKLAMAGERDWDHVDECLHDWIVALRAHGVAGLLHRIERATGLTARLLATEGGERALSDLRHVAELLDAWQAAHPSSIAVLVGWLTEQIHDAPRDADAARRLESDADAITIQTIHGAKGLEFPVVLLPSVWETSWTPDDELPVFHDENDERCIGVGSAGRVHEHQRMLAAREREEEELRLLYVALTRARHRVVAWWASTSDARGSAFARVLLGRADDEGAVVQELDRAPSPDDIAGALLALPTPSPGAIAIERAGGGADRLEILADAAATPLSVRRFDRMIDRTWARTSYSGLTAAAHDAGPRLTLDLVERVEVVEIDEAATTDEPIDDAALAVTPSGMAPDAVSLATLEALRATLLPLGEMPGGTRVGTMVHELLERIDFAAPDLAATLADAARDVGAARLVDPHVDAVMAGLALALRTPLGVAFDGRRLCDLARADRLDELTFDLPLAGGDTPHGAVTMDAIADVFATELASDDPLVTYHERLRDPLLATEVRGFLNGSIDLVARIGSRHVVVDYKTNRLAPTGEPLTAWHYRPEALAEAMQDAHYPLQAALYAVALHRFLRWKLPHYDPSHHLGGVAYLFLRGMAGPDLPLVDGHPCGVFTWQPPASFVTALSSTLDRGAP